VTNTLQEFHAHIYFTQASEASAESLREKILTEFAEKEVQIWPLVRRPVGPHPIPMFEMNFKKDALDSVTSWLEKERMGHVVLIHPVTGNDLLDHTIHARWLGKALVLDVSNF
jgi:DOPA 4,5-dioxygenase